MGYFYNFLDKQCERYVFCFDIASHLLLCLVWYFHKSRKSVSSFATYFMAYAKMKLTNLVLLQIYLDIPNLDYTTESYIYIVRDGFDLPERYTWPRGIIHAVADIVKQRHILLHNKHAENKRRESLLRKVNRMEDEFVETACKTLI